MPKCANTIGHIEVYIVLSCKSVKAVKPALLAHRLHKRHIFWGFHADFDNNQTKILYACSSAVTLIYNTVAQNMKSKFAQKLCNKKYKKVKEVSLPTLLKYKYSISWQCIFSRFQSMFHLHYQNMSETYLATYN